MAHDSDEREGRTNIDTDDVRTVEPADGHDADRPDKPISEWSPEERARVAHSHDAPSKDDPGYEDDESYDDRGLLVREQDEDLGLERRGEKVHEMDAGVSDDNRVPATTSAMGVPQPTDLAPEGTEATVDINTADVEELCKLRGVSEADAREIVAYRDEHGPFSSINDLQNLRAFARSRVATLARQGAFAGGGDDEGDGD